MNKSHYVSLEMARLLAEAGILFLESTGVWINCNLSITQPELKVSWHLRLRDEAEECYDFAEEVISAPSLMDIMDILPDVVHIWKNYFNNWSCYKRDLAGSYTELTANTAPDAAAKMAIKLKEENTNA